MTSDLSPCDSALRRSGVLASLFTIAIAMVAGDRESPGSTTPKPSGSSSASSSSTNATSSGAMAAGQLVTLDASQFDLQQITAAASEPDFDRYIEAGKANDLLGVVEMKEDGRIFFLPNGTHALVLEYTPQKAKIRVFGPGKPSRTFKYYGRTAWVLSPTLKAK
jgi:hypothetical protein